MAVATTPPLIPLQGKLCFTQTLPEAKYVKPEREYLANYYLVSEIVEGIETWYYYPVKISKERKGNFYKLEVCPPVLREGIVCVDKSFIHVPLNDLIRRNINVTRTIKLDTTTETGSTSSTTKPTKSKSIFPAADKSGTSLFTSNEDSQNIDMAFKDQIQSLQYLEDAKEGFWEISNNPQS